MQESIRSIARASRRAGRTPRALIPGLVAAVLVIAGAACSGEGAGDLTGLDGDVPNAAVLADGSDGSGSSGSGSGDSGDRVRVRARLNPVINVDASGHARSEDERGTANDRADGEVEIAKADFDELGIDAADGFGDEVVRLVVTRGGTQIFRVRLRFSENRANDITFEFDIVGAAAPEFRPGDVGVVRVNGIRTLRGVFRLD